MREGDETNLSQTKLGLRNVNYGKLVKIYIEKRIDCDNHLNEKTVDRFRSLDK